MVQHGKGSIILIEAEFLHLTLLSLIYIGCQTKVQNDHNDGSLEEECLLRMEGGMDYNECESGWLIVENDLSTRLTKPEQLRYGRDLLIECTCSYMYF